MITLEPKGSGHVFTRNPIMLDMDTAGQVAFSVYGQGYTRANPAYSGVVTAPAVVNVAELLEAIVPKMTDPGNSSELLVPIETNNSVTVEVNALDEQGEPVGASSSFPLVAHVGGVSKQNYRRLMDADTNIFEARFLNGSCNFFLTTRTADYRLALRETEVYPLAFFYPQEGMLRLKELAGGRELAVPGVVGSLYALNLAAVRKYFFDEYGVIVNAFEVYAGDSFACAIAIEEAPASRERCRLKFRNSYGAFEVVDITGAMSITPTFDDEEDGAGYKRYDSVIDDFTMERPRVPLSEVMNVSTGFKTNRELRFLLDMLASDEVYLLDFAEVPLRVLVTAEELSYSHRPNGPQEFNLVIAPADEELNITDFITDVAAGARGRVFTDEFTEHFN